MPKKAAFRRLASPKFLNLPPVLTLIWRIFKRKSFNCDLTSNNLINSSNRKTGNKLSKNPIRLRLKNKFFCKKGDPRSQKMIPILKFDKNNPKGKPFLLKTRFSSPQNNKKTQISVKNRFTVQNFVQNPTAKKSNQSPKMYQNVESKVKQFINS